MKDFGNRLRRLRRDADMSQAELAQQLGVVPSAVGKYERLDDSYPSVEVLLKIADYFNVSTDYLLRGVQPTAVMSNNISGELNNSSLIQANHGSVIVGNRTASPEGAELLRIYESLPGRDRLKLLNFAAELDEKGKVQA